MKVERVVPPPPPTDVQITLTAAEATALRILLGYVGGSGNAVYIKKESAQEQFDRERIGDARYFCNSLYHLLANAVPPP